MTQHWVSDPIGLIVPLTSERSEIQVPRGFVVDTAIIVQTSSNAVPPKSFYVSRYLHTFADKRCLLKDRVQIRLLDVPVWEGRFAPTHKIEWHFKKDVPINLVFGQVGPNPASQGYELHLSGKFIDEQTLSVHIESSNVHADE